MKERFQSGWVFCFNTSIVLCTEWNILIEYKWKVTQKHKSYINSSCVSTWAITLSFFPFLVFPQQLKLLDVKKEETIKKNWKCWDWGDGALTKAEMWSINNELKNSLWSPKTHSITLTPTIPLYAATYTHTKHPNLLDSRQLCKYSTSLNLHSKHYYKYFYYQIYRFWQKISLYHFMQIYVNLYIIILLQQQ